ncbi:MAG: polyisoprenoid-binding protein [Candidatus Competibacteraceae bacterium]|nr:polyisoprenoid-binding protein [Candidatus Competibacteraceae bacterium]
MKPFALAALFAVLAPLATAASYEIDAAHSTALFRINHLGFSFTYGTFSEVTGTIAFDAEAPEAAKVDVAIKTASIDTQVTARDEHLRGEDFLDAAKYPEMSFKSTAWKKVDDSTFAITGDFTLHGVTKSITVEMKKIGQGKGMKGEERIGFEGSFTIKRSDYGMDKMLPGVGDEVNIVFGTEGVKS